MLAQVLGGVVAAVAIVIGVPLPGSAATALVFALVALRVAVVPAIERRLATSDRKLGPSINRRVR
ncbi:hypothetical protein [Mycolicibacterium elephantis]|uniref:Uncharacterized protein n=1 Tax=Mycolicibacterium elephantis DSM 44368 TaxID=1335622 RepID=A0A439DUE6_9MYCO|nr:hypothetical protein [Mycolicibacterium elephantis]MCV7220984.1 hypothetical protein [Mycolicibacterium elephantis]RWA20217.1 hypothetical protein MELE44368_18645 [Mycolicibacterium elephantis DSM 44368]